MSKATRDHDLVAIGLLDEPMRRNLYDWVVAQARPVGREQAAKALGITRALATFHLDRLTAGGLLEGGYRRLTGRSGPGAGRPARVYWRAERAFNVALPERRYDRAAELFATALADIAGDSMPPPLEEAARELGEELGSSAVGAAPTPRLLTALDAAGYEPYLEESGTIRLRNCPFHGLIEQHRPLMCRTNLIMAEGITHGAHVTALHAVLDPQPGFCCVAFVPGEEPAAAAATPPPHRPSAPAA
jgi:predicted ArsR family transcriptional regulator